MHDAISTKAGSTHQYYTTEDRFNIIMHICVCVCVYACAVNLLCNFAHSRANVIKYFVNMTVIHVSVVICGKTINLSIYNTSIHACATYKHVL